MKSEYRNPKFEANSKSEIPINQAWLQVFRISDFEPVSNFDIRISNLS